MKVAVIINPKANSGISSAQEDVKSGRQINILISEGDQDATGRLPHFSVQYGIQDGVVALGVLHQQWITKSQGTLQVLTEGNIQETGRQKKYLLNT